MRSTTHDVAVDRVWPKNCQGGKLHGQNPSLEGGDGRLSTDQVACVADNLGDRAAGIDERRRGLVLVGICAMTIGEVITPLAPPLHCCNEVEIHLTAMFCWT